MIKIFSLVKISIKDYKKKLICFEMPGLTAMLNSWRQLVYIGIPAALTGALGPLTAAVITWLVSDYGTEAVAAAGAGSPWNSAPSQPRTQSAREALER